MNDAATFEQHRSLVFSIVSRMLGGVGEAEDMVRETFERWCRQAGQEIESANPLLETRVFLLHEVFDYDYSDVGKIVGKSEANRRQMAVRAREHLAVRRPRFQTDPVTRSLCRRHPNTPRRQSMAFELAADRGRSIYLVRNPDKLKHPRKEIEL